MLLKFTSRARKLCEYEYVPLSSSPFVYRMCFVCVCWRDAHKQCCLFTTRYCCSLFEILVVLCLKTHQITFSSTQRREYNFVVVVASSVLVLCLSLVFMHVNVFDGRCEFQKKITQHIHEQTKRAWRQRRTMHRCIRVWPLYVHSNIRYISNGINIILMPFASHHFVQCALTACLSSSACLSICLSLSLSFSFYFSNTFDTDRRHQKQLIASRKYVQKRTKSIECNKESPRKGRIQHRGFEQQQKTEKKK